MICINSYHLKYRLEILLYSQIDCINFLGGNKLKKKKMEETPDLIEKRQRKQINKYSKNVNNKKVVTALAFLLSAGIMGGACYMVFRTDQKTIQVCSYGKSMSIGQTIDINDIMAKDILKSEYKAMEQSQLTLPDGSIVKGQKYVPYDHRMNIVGYAIAYGVNSGDFVTPEEITQKSVDINPWYSNIVEGQEIYTLAFDSSDVYARYLVPGAKVKMRVISAVPTSEVEAARAAVKENIQKTDETPNAFREAILPFKVFTGTDSDTESHVSESVFDGIKIMDALNSGGESIFDIYYNISNMETSAREAYIQANADSLKGRIVPSKLILIVDAEEGDRLAEYEQTQKSAYKYTVIKQEPEEDENGSVEMYQKFNDISTRIAKYSLGG